MSSQTITATGTRVHFMGDEYSRQTACGRFVALVGSSVKTTDIETDVTCENCRKAMGA